MAALGQRVRSESVGRESTSYFLTISPDSEDAVILALREGGAQLAGSGHTWVELRVRDPHRYWIDLRVHRAPEPLLEIRIALTNDEWSIRAPLEAAFSTLPAEAARHPLRDEDGAELGTTADEDWSRRLEENYEIRRADFVTRVGDFTAPLSADHVYMYIHQTGMRRDDDAELEWRREREISRMQQMWEGAPRVELPPDHPETLPEE